ncbi:CPBP family intramembrane glutamic endopeptidase [Clostridium sp. AN503]|uniref:CPBP family intramembrane glutamic endopeptidase n=1 Tax=Clostridium sp. AN503 TaxID=3160598 RepID=UPI0034598651
MAKRVKQALLFFWRMIYPLLLYQALTELVFAGYHQVTGTVSEDRILQLTAAGALLALIPLGHLYYQLRASGQDGAAEDSRRHLPVTGWVIVWCVAAGISASLCFNNLLALLPLPVGQAENVMDLLSRPSFVMQLFCTVLILPLTEELIFRGLGYWRMRKELPFLWAAVLSAVYFGLYHGNLYQGIYAAFLGGFLALLFERTDRLLAVWTFHAAANLISVTANAMAWDRGIFEYTAVRVAIFTASGLLLTFSFYKLREDGRKSEITIHSDTLL